MHVLQEEETGAAMDLGEVKPGVGLTVVPKNNKTSCYFLIGQESEFILIAGSRAGHAWLVIQPVVIAKAAVVQQLVDGPAALTAESFIAQGNGGR
jgi:hypothetical protein